MTYRFRLRGKNFRHSWEKDCAPEGAMLHAKLVAGECAKDSLYEGTSIRVIDNSGNEVAIVPVPKRA